MDKLTIKDIAKMAGISTTVVSFVINNKPGVNEETRRKVNEVIQKTNFKPSVNSRRLVYQKSFNISIVLRKDSSPFSNLFYFEIAQGLLEKSKEFGYNIVFTDISEDHGKIILPEIIDQKDTDGIIFLQDTEATILNEMDQRGIPYIVVDSHSNNNHYPCISANYELSAFTATKYLLENGHKDIAFICSSFISNFYTQVFSGFKRALESYNISIPSSWIQMEASDEASAYQCMKDILSKNGHPTAAFCAADMYAIGAVKCAKDMGYQVPADISFTSIDDILLARYIEPALTTVRIDKVMMGSLAMELLVKKINGEPIESLTVDSDNLIVRNSVKKL